MRRVVLTYRRLLADARTCARCGDTEAAVRLAFRLLALELAGRGVALALEVEDLAAARLAESNTLLINGWPIEHWLGGTTVETDCPGCADLTGRDSACCRALSLDGEVHESLTPDLIAQAIRRSL